MEKITVKLGVGLSMATLLALVFAQTAFAHGGGHHRRHHRDENRSFFIIDRPIPRTCEVIFFSGRQWHRMRHQLFCHVEFRNQFAHNRFVFFIDEEEVNNENEVEIEENENENEIRNQNEVRNEVENED